MIDEILVFLTADFSVTKWIAEQNTVHVFCYRMHAVTLCLHHLAYNVWQTWVECAADAILYIRY